MLTTSLLLVAFPILMTAGLHQLSVSFHSWEKYKADRHRAQVVQIQAELDEIHGAR